MSLKFLNNIQNYKAKKGVASLSQLSWDNHNDVYPSRTLSTHTHSHKLIYMIWKILGKNLDHTICINSLVTSVHNIS